MHPAVGMMDHARRVNAQRFVEGEGLLKGLQGALPLERAGKAVSHDITAVGIGNQGQVGEAFPDVDIGDVAHHEPAVRRGDIPGSRVDTVLVDTVGMARVRGTRAVAAPPEHQAVGTEYGIEPVTADGKMFPEMGLAQFIQFAAAGPGKAFRGTEALAIQHDTAGQYVGGGRLVMVPVIPLAGDAEQSAERTDRIVPFALMECEDYPASDFFLMGMLNSASARSIMQS